MSWPCDLDLFMGNLVPVCPVWTRNIQMLCEYSRKMAVVQIDIDLLRLGVRICQQCCVLNQNIQRKLNSRVTELEVLTTRRAIILNLLSLDLDLEDAHELMAFANE